MTSNDVAIQRLEEMRRHIQVDVRATFVGYIATMFDPDHMNYIAQDIPDVTFAGVVDQAYNEWSSYRKMRSEAA